MKRRGFTLVELLIVIGIIAILFSLLMPALSRMRSMSNRTKCASNLQQMGVGLGMYVRDNRDFFPAAASYSGERPDDWVWWEPDRIDRIGRSALAPYLGGAEAFKSILHCPADDLTFRARLTASKYGGYFFSYSMNSNMVNGAAGPGISFNTVRTPDLKWVIMEEDENSIDDGYCTPDPLRINLLAIRHDSTRREPDTTATGLTLNLGCRGNVLFCDGHADYIDRATAHNRSSYDPSF